MHRPMLLFGQLEFAMRCGDCCVGHDCVWRGALLCPLSSGRTDDRQLNQLVFGCQSKSLIVVCMG